MHTRRYHGLLVAALDPPRGRHVFLSHVDATLSLPRDRTAGRATEGPWELSKHQFPGIDPLSGPFYLERFDQDPLPRWTYAVDGGSFEVTLGLARGQNAVVLRYSWQGPRPLLLRLRPLLAARNFHHLQREHGGMIQRVEMRAGEVSARPRPELPRICFSFAGTFIGSPDWWRRFEYLEEQARGLDYLEDLWTPGVFEAHVSEAPLYLVAAVERLPEASPEDLLEETRAAIMAEDPGPERPVIERRLRVAAEVFRADRAPRPGIIAGYPWFEVWGRDSLIALPGLYLVPGKAEGAIGILRGLIGAMQDGLVPNRIPDAGEEAEFNTADATLWLFEAGRLLSDVVGDDHPFVREELLPALTRAFEAALRGTRNHIHVTKDGLFAAGRAGVDALTWMDARVDGRPVTSRAGCPVELSALWARGCDTLSRLALAVGDAALSERAREASARARDAFRERFWCEETGYPFDVISEVREGEGFFVDASVRPNAVVALAVDPGCFSVEQGRALLAVAERELLTGVGLRTLSPRDGRYVGGYGGGVAARDGGYHQGAVWPWLLGFYTRAVLHVFGAGARERLLKLLGSAAGCELALGQVAEIADGEFPHRGNGCVAQAWSVAELLRMAAWDLKG